MELCKPLFNALQKNAFSWNKEQHEAFDKLNHIMRNAPLLALPNYKQPFTLEAGACGYVMMCFSFSQTKAHHDKGSSSFTAQVQITLHLRS
jgi:hypothetical protein